MRSEGYCVCLSVCLSVRYTSGASFRPENAVTYSAGNEGQNICGVFSETAPLQRSSIPSNDGNTYRRPFFVRKARMRIIVFFCVSVQHAYLHAYFSCIIIYTRMIHRRGFSTLVLFIMIVILTFVMHVTCM